VARRVIRYLSALLILTYGFAKINGSQFTILDSELDKPTGQVSGFWLTWYYFGFSPFYGTFLALVEIVGAILLTFRRTTLLGACILAPMLANIVLIDIFYGVELGATATAILLLAAMVWLIIPQRRELLAIFWPATGPANSTALVITGWSVRLAMFALAFGFTYWAANYNNRNPTPIDGVWDVVRVEPQLADEPKVIFFEYNRAGMAVFKSVGGIYQQHEFEVDPKTQRIQMWGKWLAKRARIFEGRYTVAGSELTLNGTWGDSGEIALRLRQSGR
jgi:hypothetical protein